MKKKLLVSFSGGETSAFMAQWLWKNKQDEYDMKFVFANTGIENEETLQFVQWCSDYFKFPVVWVEALVNPVNKIGTSFKLVNFQTASRNGEPFEEVIKKYGIPNQKFPHCTRELKQRPIKAYAKAIGWNDYYLAIGIRSDEMDRQNAKREEERIIYPLISDISMTKPKVNFFWKMQPFRLNLKGYQGNCITCWKKSDSKLFQLANENERSFMFFGKMELRYGTYVPESRSGKGIELPIKFFRKNRSVQDIIDQAKDFKGKVIDDSKIYDLDGESCEVFSSCSES